MSTINVGQFNLMRVDRKVDFGFYMDDGGEGILLPKRFVPSGLQIGDTISVFVYHDSDNRLIATTQEPFAVVGDIAALKVVEVTSQGAFLDWGLMKDLFVPVSQQLSNMRLGGKYLVKLYLDKQTGRVAATEKIDNQISNDVLTVKEGEKVKIQVYRESEIGYVVIVNQVHQGLVYKNEVFTHLHIGQFIDEAFVKKIREDNKLDIGLGKQGGEKLADDNQKIMSLLKSHKGFLPYHDKSAPDDIYAFFGMSKKAFNDFNDKLKVVAMAGSVKEGVQEILRHSPDLVFLDIQMPGLDGLNVFKQLASKPAVIFCSAYAEHAVAAFELSAVDYLLKPFSAERFQQALFKACGKIIAAADRRRSSRPAVRCPSWSEAQVRLRHRADRYRRGTARRRPSPTRR